MSASASRSSASQTQRGWQSDGTSTQGSAATDSPEHNHAAQSLEKQHQTIVSLHKEIRRLKCERLEERQARERTQLEARHREEDHELVMQHNIAKHNREHDIHEVTVDIEKDYQTALQAAQDAFDNQVEQAREHQKYQISVADAEKEASRMSALDKIAAGEEMDRHELHDARARHDTEITAQHVRHKEEQDDLEAELDGENHALEQMQAHDLNSE